MTRNRNSIHRHKYLCMKCGVFGAKAKLKNKKLFYKQIYLENKGNYVLRVTLQINWYLYGRSQRRKTELLMLLTMLSLRWCRELKPLIICLAFSLLPWRWAHSLPKFTSSSFKSMPFAMTFAPRLATDRTSSRSAAFFIVEQHPCQTFFKDCTITAQ